MSVVTGSLVFDVTFATSHRKHTAVVGRWAQGFGCVMFCRIISEATACVVKLSMGITSYNVLFLLSEDIFCAARLVPV